MGSSHVVAVLVAIAVVCLDLAVCNQLVATCIKDLDDIENRLLRLSHMINDPTNQ